MPAAALSDLLAALDAAADRPVLRLAGGPDRTGADLLRASARLARALSRTGPAGSRLAVAAHPTFETVAALLGAFRAGWIAVPLGLRYRGRELAHILTDCAPAATAGIPHPAEHELTARGVVPPSAVVSDPPNAGSEAPDPDDPRTPCLVVYTSGTTGRSKGAVHTQRSLFGAMAALADAWGFGPDDTLAHALPLHHVHGLCIGIFAALLRGVTVRLAPRFSPDGVVEAFAEGATVFCGVPTQYAKILAHLDERPGAAAVLAGGRLFTSGSAALPVRAFEGFEARTGHRILERYGMTETMITLSNPLDGPRRPGTVGRPLPGFEIRIDEAAEPGLEGAGELRVRGIGLFDGYFGAPEATAACFDEDGFFRTGDLVRREDDGTIRIVGRRSADIVKTGGFKVATPEIEEVLREHPLVAEVAVFGVPDDLFGEAIAAAVVPSRPTVAPEALEAALRDHCVRHLADYKKPRRLLVVDALPRNAMGKVQKHVLRDRLARPP